jgi:hypothetical protein
MQGIPVTAEDAALAQRLICPRCLGELKDLRGMGFSPTNLEDAQRCYLWGTPEHDSFWCCRQKWRKVG